MIDGSASNRKYTCFLVRSIAVEEITFEFPSSFAANDKIMFIIFFIAHAIKWEEHNLISKDDFFHFLVFTLSNKKLWKVDVVNLSRRANHVTNSRMNWFRM